MADKTMPPNDPMEGSPAMPGEMGATAPMGNMAPPAGGDVMINLPKVAFDAMHQIVMQLASGLDQLAKEVNQQAAGSPPGGGEMPPDMGGDMGGNMPLGGAAPEDEEFLRSMMEEGNSKSR